MTEQHAASTPQARAAFDYITQHDWTVCAVNSDKKATGPWSIGGPNRFDYRNAEGVFTKIRTAFGIITGPSRLIIIDLDNADAIRSWADRFGIPTTRIANSPRGKHLYFLAPNDTIIRPGVSIMPGVDIRAGESYIIAPPSITLGGAYVWANDNPIEPLPREVIDLISERSHNDKERIPDGERIPEGKRNDALFNRALRAVRAGLSPEAVHGAVRAEAEAYADGTMTEQEIVDICDSARAYHEKHDADDEQTIDEIVDSVDTMETAELAPSLQRLDIAEMLETEPPEIEWVWQDYLAKGTLNLLHGDAGLGKSLISLAIATACTTGQNVLNRTTSKSAVAIIDAENSRDEIHRRIKKGYDRVSNPKLLNYYRTDEAILGHKARTAELFAWIHQETEASLYILDSQRALWEGDEKEQAEAGRMLRYLARVAEALDICILIIHHDTKAGQYSGSSDISAALTGSRLHLTRASKRDDADSEEWSQRKLVHAKCRLGAEQPVEQFKIEMHNGIELVHAGPTSNIDYISRMIAAYAREHEAWPIVPTRDIHAEIEDMKERRTRANVYAHMHANGIIESSPKHGERHVRFVDQTALNSHP
jgi:RecA-family ATPase